MEGSPKHQRMTLPLASCRPCPRLRGTRTLRLVSYRGRRAVRRYLRSAGSLVQQPSRFVCPCSGSCSHRLNKRRVAIIRARAVDAPSGCNQDTEDRLSNGGNRFGRWKSPAIHITGGSTSTLSASAYSNCRSLDNLKRQPPADKAGVFCRL